MTIEKRIRNEIELRIRSGEWKPGYRIPFEHELVAQHGCARATVSKALLALAKAGLIERRRKAGSFVAQPHIESTALGIPDIGAAITARGETYRYELKQRGIREGSFDNDAERRLAARGPLLELEGVHHAGSLPFCHEARIIDLAAVPEAEKQDFTASNPGTWLLSHVPWNEARHRISAVGVDGQAAKALLLAEGTPCLRIERWTWRMGAGVTYVTQIFPGHRYDLIAEFSPQS